MKSLIRTLAVIMVLSSVSLHAEQSFAQQGSSKRLVKLDEGTGDLVEIPQAQAVAPVQAATAAPQAVTASPIVINNNQRSSQGTSQSAGLNASQTAIQDQPTNVIEDSPLTMSNADRRRRDRQALEVHTEQKIVEKLEESRMEDERRRSERLFGNGMSSQQQVVVQQPPVVVVEEVKPVKEIRTVVKEVEHERPVEDTQYYVQGLVGTGSYPDAANVKGSVATGFAVGMVTEDRVIAEGSFQYSQYDIDQSMVSYGLSPFKKMTQYNFGGAIKYQILPGKIRPVVGALAGYTLRNYKDQQVYNNYGYTYGYQYGQNQDVSTNAFDIGILAGLDIQLTRSFSVGVDFRYMKNISYKDNTDYQNTYRFQRVGKPVEEMNYYLGSLTGRFTF